MTPIANVLSIAGSDPSGGAGIQADLKTFAALGCYGMAVPSALTAQNTRGVGAVHLPPADFVAAQIAMIFADIAVAAVKIGMLGSAAIVEAVAGALEPHAGIPIVLDPVLVATSGAVLGSDAVVAAMRTHLFPMASLVTPNLAEAARLGATDVPASRDAMEALADRLFAAERAGAWLVKGGHAADAAAADVLRDRAGMRWFSAARIATRNTHGTGCTLSSAIAACLAQGAGLDDAITRAKVYLGLALGGADALRVGTGAGPLDHFAGLRSDPA